MSSRATLCLLAASLALAAAPALAQAPRPARPAAKPEAPPAPPPIYPCRTAQETCHLAIVAGSQVIILYTSANVQSIDEKPVDAVGPDGAKLDLAKNDGRVVMLTGALEPKAGLKGAELIEVASPLASLAIKAQLAGGEAGPQAGGKGGPKRR